MSLAHIRGGNELGREWYDKGKGVLKSNSLADLSACAQHLFSERYTTPDMLACLSSSAGAAIMGKVI